jgi:flagellar hook-length control protein FliK
VKILPRIASLPAPGAGKPNSAPASVDSSEGDSPSFETVLKAHEESHNEVKDSRQTDQHPDVSTSNNPQETAMQAALAAAPQTQIQPPPAPLALDGSKNGQIDPLSQLTLAAEVGTQAAPVANQVPLAAVQDAPAQPMQSLSPKAATPALPAAAGSNGAEPSSAPAATPQKASGDSKLTQAFENIQSDSTNSLPVDLNGNGAEPVPTNPQVSSSEPAPVNKKDVFSENKANHNPMENTAGEDPAKTPGGEIHSLVSNPLSSKGSQTDPAAASQTAEAAKASSSYRQSSTADTAKAAPAASQNIDTQAVLAAANDPNKLAAPPHLATEPARLAEAHQTETIDQITRQIEAMVQKKRTTLHLQLYPENMGRVDLHLTSSSHGLNVTLTADQAGTSRMLESQVDQLRINLAQAGLQLGQVNVGQHSAQQQANWQTPARNPGKISLSSLSALMEVQTETEISSRGSNSSLTGIDYRI